MIKKKCCVEVFFFFMQCFDAHVFQVLTVDLENQAAELQEEELPVAAPIINIPHISAR